MYTFRVRVKCGEIYVKFRVKEKLERDEFITKALWSIKELEKRHHIYEMRSNLVIRKAIYFGVYSEISRAWHWALSKDGSSYCHKGDLREQRLCEDIRERDRKWLETNFERIKKSIKHMSKIGLIKNHSSYRKSIREWCRENGYSEPELVGNEWWAIPAGGVLPICINQFLRRKVLTQAKD